MRGRTIVQSGGEGQWKVSVRAHDLQCPKIPLIHSEIARKQAVGMDKGMGSNKEITENKLAPCKYGTALGAGNLKHFAALGA